MSSTLDEFRDLIMDIDDSELLDIAEDMLKDMIQIQDMKEKIERLEESLSEGKRAAFWFFAMGLDREQIDLATNTIIGRRRTLHDKEQRRARDEQDSSIDPDEDEEESLLSI